MRLEGKALKYGDNVDTDAIIAGKHTKNLDPGELARHAMEDLDPKFGERVRPGDFIVAGREFGCGSSREQAPLALKHAGVSCIVAKSFARIFYRNAINIGLPVIECDVDGIDDGDILRYDLGNDEVVNVTKQRTMTIRPLPKIMVDILGKGGLVNYLREFGDWRL